MKSVGEQIDDRFICKRSNTDVANFNLGHSSVDSLSDFEFEDEKDYFQRTKFVNTARKASNILTYRKKILSALNITHSNVLKNHASKKILNYNELLHGISPWPVYSRKKSLIRSPETVLDMPDIDSVDTSLYRHVIDWGKQGQIATIFHGEVYMWPCANETYNHTQTGRTISDCVKWDQSGKRFAVSRSESRISIIHGETLKILKTVTCKCLRCRITAIEWSKSGHVITGCSKGSITIISNKEPVRQFYKISNGEIIDLKLSCNNTYLLVSTLRGSTSILKWPMTWNTSRTMVFKVSSENPYCIKTTAWHPWKESILVVGEMDNGVAVWNVNNQKLLDFNTLEPYFKKASSCILDYLTFNPFTAELLVSFYHENPDPDGINGCNFLTVFSDLHTRVDEVRYHIGRVPHVLWDGTGTKLATIGTDENLAIWNFFGWETEEEKLRHCEKKKKKKSSIFESKLLFGSCIR